MVERVWRICELSRSGSEANLAKRVMNLDGESELGDMVFLLLFGAGFVVLHCALCFDCWFGGVEGGCLFWCQGLYRCERFSSLFRG